MAFIKGSFDDVTSYKLNRDNPIQTIRSKGNIEWEIIARANW
jgi:hypothetical protein